MKMSPGVLDSSAASFSPENATERYSHSCAFRHQEGGKEPIVEMTTVMEKIEQTVAAAKEPQKIAMAVSLLGLQLLSCERIAATELGKLSQNLRAAARQVFALKPQALG